MHFIFSSNSKDVVGMLTFIEGKTTKRRRKLCFIKNIVSILASNMWDKYNKSNDLILIIVTCLCKHLNVTHIFRKNGW